MVLTTTLLSITRGRRPARCADTAVARPPGPPPTITRSASFAIAFAILNDCCRTDRNRALDSDDLVAARADAHVGDLGFDQRLNAIQIPARFGRQIRQSSGGGSAGSPPFEPFVPRYRTL